MKNFSQIFRKEIFPIGLILILTFSRLIPHYPNFTPVIAVAIMSSYFFKNIYLSFIVIILSMLISDVFIGFYNNIFFVYLSLLLITFIFYRFNTRIKFKNLFIFGFFGSLIFFVISNFVVWLLSNMYDKNLNGIIYCYFLALPLFINTLLSTVFFSYLAFIANNFFILAYKK